MNKVDPYAIVKQAETDPGTASIIALGLGGGLGALWDAYDESHDKPVENKWRRPLLGAVLASTPLILYDLARGSFDRGSEGNRTMPFLTRYFSTDKKFWEKPEPQQRYNEYIASKMKYYPIGKAQPSPVPEIIPQVKKSEWATGIGPIPVNHFNQVTWIDASRGRTPLEAAGLVTNTLSQTQQRTGSNLVSPGQVINTLVNAGIGYGTAWLAGKTLGAMANVSPATQKKLCEIGAWGGMLSGINNAARRY